MIERYLKELRAMEGLPKAIASHVMPLPKELRIKRFAPKAEIFGKEVNVTTVLPDMADTDLRTFKWTIQSEHPETREPFHIDLLYQLPPQKERERWKKALPAKDNQKQEPRVNAIFYRGNPNRGPHTRWNLSSATNAMQKQAIITYSDGKPAERSRPLRPDEKTAIRRFLRDHITLGHLTSEEPKAGMTRINQDLEQQAKLQIINWLRAIE